MRNQLAAAISKCLSAFRRERSLPDLWLEPLVAFVDANHPLLPGLRKSVHDTHHLPQDFMDEPSIIVAYYVPFTSEVVSSNIGRRNASELWVLAYIQTQAAIRAVDACLLVEVAGLGGRAALPQGAGYVADGVYKSSWSHRHIAHLGGLGTLGLHNLLITERGCSGRYSTIITDLPAAPDAMLQEERCLYKKNGGCGACVQRCVAGALEPGGFDRIKCAAMCAENAEYYGNAESGACGKCSVGVPCSLRSPA